MKRVLAGWVFAATMMVMPSFALALTEIVNFSASDGTNPDGSNLITFSWDLQGLPASDLSLDSVRIFQGANCSGGPSWNIFRRNSESSGSGTVQRSGVDYTFSAHYIHVKQNGEQIIGPCSNSDTGFARNASLSVIALQNPNIPSDGANLISIYPTRYPLDAAVVHYTAYRSTQPSDACNPSNAIREGSLTADLFNYTASGLPGLFIDSSSASLTPGAVYYYSFDSTGENGSRGFCGQVAASRDLWAPTSFDLSGPSGSPLPGSPLAISMSWTVVPGAVRYAMYRDGAYWGETSNTNYVDYDYHAPGYSSRYSIAAIDANGRTSQLSIQGLGYRTYASTQNMTASLDEAQRVVLSWDSSISPPQANFLLPSASTFVLPPGERYRIYRSLTNSGCQGAPLIDSEAYQYPDGRRYFFDVNAIPGTTYYYSVKPYYVHAWNDQGVWRLVTIVEGACSSVVAGSRPTFWATGRVTLSGAGLPGVRVEADASHFAISNDQGNFAVGGLNGIYTLRASKDGYSFAELFSNPVDLTGGSAPNANFLATQVASPATQTPTPTLTRTATPTSTGTPSATSTATSSPTPTATATLSPTSTATRTSTPTATASSAPTVTSSPTPTVTATPSNTPLTSPTPTSTPTRMGTPTGVPPTQAPLATPTGGADLTLLAPRVDCVEVASDGSRRAYFGYINNSGVDLTVPIGTENGFAPLPVDRGQPSAFFSGVVSRAFGAALDSPSLSWTLGNGTATANNASPLCCGSGSCEQCSVNDLSSGRSALLKQLSSIEKVRARYVRGALTLLKRSGANAQAKLLKKRFSVVSKEMSALNQRLKTLPAEFLVCPDRGCEDMSLVSRYSDLGTIVSNLSKDTRKEASKTKNVLGVVPRDKSASFVKKLTKAQKSIRASLKVFSDSVASESLKVRGCGTVR